MRGALAGIAAAGTWAAVEPALGRALRTPYSDVKLLGALAGRGRARIPAGLAIHLANGALFGWVFQRLAGGGVRRGILAAEAENVVLWPAMAVMDRIHPDRRSGALPPLATSPRVAAYELITHALFGTILGALTSRR